MNKPTADREPESSQRRAEREKNQKDSEIYLDVVMERFKDKDFDNYNPYIIFLDIIKDFKSKRIGLQSVMHQTSNLFRGHTDLIMGLQPFLPAGYRYECHKGNGFRGRDTFTIITPAGTLEHSGKFTPAVQTIVNRQE
ncbi:hypothetical protein SCHPADRAFT_836292 [Schizopora paradoxa]|uniref:Uncharacterized protein n=1 Tax=Schizopora paradoxa TaxID=27342 RepID=A0A0H2RDQ1_9AGAM|nr:hypothetical protein SCHPADRAFT_836292 [Schizopora paradoxa]